MKTHKQILKKSQSIARLERKLSLSKIKERKAEIRRKIQWGGLVVKAGLDHLPKDVILGVLIRAKQEMEKESAAEALYQSIGKAAFMEYGDEKHGNHS